MSPAKGFMKKNRRLWPRWDVCRYGGRRWKSYSHEWISRGLKNNNNNRIRMWKFTNNPIKEFLLPLDNKNAIIRCKKRSNKTLLRWRRNYNSDRLLALAKRAFTRHRHRNALLIPLYLEWSRSLSRVPLTGSWYSSNRFPFSAANAHPLWVPLQTVISGPN